VTPEGSRVRPWFGLAFFERMLYTCLGGARSKTSGGRGIGGNMKKRVTIKDVAQHAGVSIGTVSRFIGKSGYVGKESRARIEKAIKLLHYMPNTTARSMINKRSNIIGIAVPEVNNPFLADLYVRVEALLYDNNYSIMFCNTGYRQDKLELFVDDLIMRNAEGLMLLATDVHDGRILDKIRRFIHGVSVGQRILNFDCVNFDDHKNSYELTGFLIRNGHSKIACIGFNKYVAQTMARMWAVREALEANGLPVREEYMMEFDYQYEEGDNSGYISTKKLLELPDPPTAIVSINDFNAIGAYEAIFEKGLVAGKDISVTGYDDIGMARVMNPPLTTVKCDMASMARLTADMLLKRIRNDGGEEKTGRDIILPSAIMLRGSIGQNNGLGDL
jgi:LacI family transcriptional regulator